ncbi:coiled-coil domain-containing protein 170-like [Myotis myotis]|uniref:coiled-coil domain-containing protein 170-like n=1 Tax=Myotis myotis TaxID=51298 RepID=UPI001748263E|nr:coiled-coil domain-containing protein 170-like [Myotis myotis]
MTFPSPLPTMDAAEIKACFDPPLEEVSTRNPIMYNKTTADPDHPDVAGLLVKNKNLLAELRNLQNKLFIKESSLQDMKNELESYKEDNAKQSFQIISLKNDIKDLKVLIASLTRVKSLKSINNQTPERGNLDLNERIIELENRLRVHLVERERAEQKADLLEKKLADANGFTPYMNVKGQEDTLGSFKIKGAEGLKQDIQLLTKRLEQLHHHHEESSQTEEKRREQKRPLKRLEGKLAVNDFFQVRLDSGRNKENSRTKNARIDENSKIFKQLEKDNKQQTLLTIKQNLQIATTQRLEEEIRQLHKQLSDLKLSNKNMKTQLTRVNILKDKTIQKLRQSLIKVEAMKGKAAMKTDNLKTTLDPTKQEARWDKDGTHQILDAVTPELCTEKNTLEVSGRPQEEVDFRETIMKMLGFNMKTADKEIIIHLRLIIQAYEASNKSKIASDCETGQNNNA